MHCTWFPTGTNYNHHRVTLFSCGAAEDVHSDLNVCPVPKHQFYLPLGNNFLGGRGSLFPIHVTFPVLGNSAPKAARCQWTPFCLVPRLLSGGAEDSIPYYIRIFFPLGNTVSFFLAWYSRTIAAASLGGGGGARAARRTVTAYGRIVRV